MRLFMILRCSAIYLWHKTRKLVCHDLYHEGYVLPGHVMGSYQQVHKCTCSSPQVSPSLKEQGRALIPGVLGKHGDLIFCSGFLCAWVVAHYCRIASAGIPVNLHLRGLISHSCRMVPLMWNSQYCLLISQLMPSSHFIIASSCIYLVVQYPPRLLGVGDIYLLLIYQI